MSVKRNTAFQMYGALHRSSGFKRVCCVTFTSVNILEFCGTQQTTRPTVVLGSELFCFANRNGSIQVQATAEFLTEASSAQSAVLDAAALGDSVKAGHTHTLCGPTFLTSYTRSHSFLQGIFLSPAILHAVQNGTFGNLQVDEQSIVSVGKFICISTSSQTLKKHL